MANTDEQDFLNWLKKIKLDQYHSKLKAIGFDSLGDIRDCDLEDIEEYAKDTTVGFKTVHQKRFIKAAKKLANLDVENAENEGENIFTTSDPYGVDQTDIDINFVLVHGLDGDSTAFINTETSKSLLNCLRSGFPRSNIIKYEYPNNSVGMMTNKQPIPVDERALHFIQGLQNELLHNKAPIIFIGHSMGGLVIKQALITAKQTPKYQDLYNRTKSVAFYATPHTGSTLANVLTKLDIAHIIGTTIAVQQLKENNPYLLKLKQDFNALAIEKKMKILSFVETQKESRLNRKIVSYKSAVCGLSDKYEETHKLDYDHTQIQRPSSLKDRRYTDLYYFITRTVFKPSEIFNYRPKNAPSDDTKDAYGDADRKSEEKEGFNRKSKRILCLDPKYNTSDDTSIALRAFEKGANLESFTTLMASVFANESKNFRETNIQNLFKDDICKQNTKILNHLLETKEYIKFIDEDKIKQSINLSMRYWNLLKESKSVIADKKDQIDDLLAVFSKFRQILNKKIAGNELTDDETGFVGYVGEEIVEWFKDNPELIKVKEQWSELHEELTREEVWWRQKLTMVREEVTKAAIEAKQKIIECSNTLGKFLTGLGVVVAAAGCIAGVLVGGIVVGGIIGAIGVYKWAKSDKNKQLQMDNLAKSETQLNTIEKHTAKVVDAFKEMAGDAGKLDFLFSDLVQQMKRPRKAAEKTDRFFKGRINYLKLEQSCNSITVSLTGLQTVCKEILDSIGGAQKRFHSDD